MRVVADLPLDKGSRSMPIDFENSAESKVCIIV